jgi:molybdate transport system substrate-binding protein
MRIALRVVVAVGILAVHAGTRSAAAALPPVDQPIQIGDVVVMTSGAFAAPHGNLVPEFERAFHARVRTVEGASMGHEPTTIPNRLGRGEAADLVILARPVLDELVAKGLVVAGSQVDLVRSRIGMVVRAGAPRPDISSLAAFTKTLLDARSIGYSSSASGVYLSTELFQKLGVADRVMPRARRIAGEPVAAAVARGDVEVGFQQMSELLPVAGVTVVGPLPEGAQRETLFSAGIVAGARNPDGGRALIRYYTSPAVAATIRAAGLEPMTVR